jgi:hypothetical protein
VIDKRYGTAWATEAYRDGFNIDRFAVFEFDRSVSFPAGATLTITLRHEPEWEQHGLGRFRLSVTGSERPVRNSGGTITPAEASLDTTRLIDLLHSGRIEEYRRDLAAVMARIDQTEHAPALSTNLAWAVAVGPAGTAEVEVALGLLESALTLKPDDALLLGAYGSVLYRAGRYRDAVASLTSCIEKRTGERFNLPDSPAGLPYDWLYLAMAHHALGDADETRRWFDHGARYVDWTTQAGREPALGQRIPFAIGRNLVLLRRVAEKELGLASTQIGNAAIVGDWKFSHRVDGMPVKNGEVAGADRVESTLRDDSGGRVRGQNHHYDGKGACYVQYALPADRRPAGLDGWALRLGPGNGYVWFGYSPDALRPVSDFSFWIRVQLRQTQADRQTIACWPGAWRLWVTPQGRLNATLREVDDKLTRMFQREEPDLAARSGKWIDIGFSFQGNAKDGVASNDVVRFYLDGDPIGTFSGDARFTMQNHLHVGMDEFGKWRSGDMLVDRMLVWHGVLDDDGFRRLSGPPGRGG